MRYSSTAVRFPTNDCELTNNQKDTIMTTYSRKLSVFLPSLLTPTHPPTPSHPGGKPPANFRLPSMAVGGYACRGAAANPYGDAATTPPAAALPLMATRGRGERLWPLSAPPPGGLYRCPPQVRASSRHDYLCSLRSPCVWPLRGLTVHPT